MIRRKLTRIEVTLDDTKELDDFFTKTTHTALSVGLSVTPSQNSASKLTSLSTLVLDRNLSQQAASSDPVNLNESAASPADLAQQPPPRLSFNPQPYSQASRFQLNSDTQQFR